MDSKIHYRSDIDGLRAVAVIAVILFHLGLKSFSGGFIGVDVFFIISGFLITTLIIKDIHQDKFSLAHFYERRILRIFPAFIAALVAVLVAGFFLYDQPTYVALGESAIASVFSMANFYFWSLAGYFDTSSLYKPLLHFWTLSVEEQFYFVLPVLLMLAFKHAKKHVFMILSALLLLSLAFSTYMVTRDLNSAFYFSHLRAWEFLFGCILAIKPIKFKPVINQVLSALGLAFILYSTFFFNESTPFPGLLALLPVTGVALIVNNGTTGASVVHKILSMEPLVFIGKISYSLYLWHWPIIVFVKYFRIVDIGLMDYAVILLSTFVISSLSWKYIENPFRARKVIRGPQTFPAAGFVILSILAFGLFIRQTNGIPARIPETLTTKPSVKDLARKDFSKCNDGALADYPDLNICKLGDDKMPPSFVLVGDSHSVPLASVIDRVALKNNKSGYLFFENGCVFLKDIVRIGHAGCRTQVDTVFKLLADNPDLKNVIIVSRWNLWVTAESYKQEPAIPVVLKDGLKDDNGITNLELIETGLRRTIQSIEALDRHVILVDAVPEVGYNVPKSVFISIMTGRNPNDLIAPTTSEYLERSAGFQQILGEIQQEFPEVEIIHPSSILCDQISCSVYTAGSSRYFDDDHLSLYGAGLLSPLFEPVFKN